MTWRLPVSPSTAHFQYREHLSFFYWPAVSGMALMLSFNCDLLLSSMFFSLSSYSLWFPFPTLWGTVPSVGNVAQPPVRKASGEWGWRAGPTFMDRFSRGKSGLHCTLAAMRLALVKTPSPWGSKCLLSIFIFPKSELDLPGMEHSRFQSFLLLHCKYPSLMYLATSCPLLSVKDNHPKQTYEDHLWCKGPRKTIKACQGKGPGALLLREWPCHPSSSTGFL